MCGARLARPRRRGGRRLGAAGQAQPMHLADDRVAGDAAELAGDLARGQPVRPELFQQLDPLVGPGHDLFPHRKCQCRWQNPPSQSGDRPNWDHSRSRNTGNCSLRDVVLNGDDATIWRDSGARVGATHFHIFLLLSLSILRKVRPRSFVHTQRAAAGIGIPVVLTPGGPEIR